MQDTLSPKCQHISNLGKAKLLQKLIELPTDSLRRLSFSAFYFIFLFVLFPKVITYSHGSDKVWLVGKIANRGNNFSHLDDKLSRYFHKGTTLSSCFAIFPNGSAINLPELYFKVCKFCFH